MVDKTNNFGKTTTCQNPQEGNKGENPQGSHESAYRFESANSSPSGGQKYEDKKITEWEPVKVNKY